MQPTALYLQRSQFQWYSNFAWWEEKRWKWGWPSIQPASVRLSQVSSCYCRPEADSKSHSTCPRQDKKCKHLKNDSWMLSGSTVTSVINVSLHTVLLYTQMILLIFPLKANTVNYVHSENTCSLETVEAKTSWVMWIIRMEKGLGDTVG